MTKVHPNAALPGLEVLPRPAISCSGSYAAAGGGGCRPEPTVLTVWRKSLLFNCNGFTVYDCSGNLVFRVDNYGTGAKAEVVLMDAAGTPLLTIRRKKLSLGDHWLIYNGEDTVNPCCSVRRHVNLRHSKSLAHVTPCRRTAAGVSGSGGAGSWGGKTYDVQGSYQQRSCTVYDERRRAVAEVRRKECAVGGVAFGSDVFRLVVQPELETKVAMAIVIVLDQMFGSRSSLIKGWD